MDSLRELLVSMTSGRPPDRVVDQFVGFCRKSALILLRKKVSGGKLSLNHLSLTVEDLALDCIADLFSRNAEGDFVQVQAYLRGLDIESMEDAELLSHMRRLVFAKVNQGIFRVYHDIDPSLSRILRNIKIAIHTLHNFEIVERFGEPYVVPAACDPLEHLPVIEPAVLKEELRSVAGRTETVPGLLAHISRCLRDQTECCRLFPLVQLALVFRSLHGGPAAADSTPGEAEMAATVSDATDVITQACAWVRERGRKKYVESGKVSPGHYGHYFTILEVALVNAIIDRNGHDITYFDEMSKLVPGLTREEYDARHKSKIEYLGRIAHRRALKELKKIF
jgi:hypothetical protein